MPPGGGDTLTGGAGNDQFRYVFASDSGFGSSADQITDFTIGNRSVQLRADGCRCRIARRSGVQLHRQRAFVNTGVGQIRYQKSGANLLVQVDINGNGMADMEDRLDGLEGQTLTGGDFLLVAACAETHVPGSLRRKLARATLGLATAG